MVEIAFHIPIGPFTVSVSDVKPSRETICAVSVFIKAYIAGFLNTSREVPLPHSFKVS